MFLDDPFQYFRIAVVIPNALWVNQSDGTLGADSQAICLGPINQWIWTAQVQLF
jgi:hypothetical protein